MRRLQILWELKDSEIMALPDINIILSLTASFLVVGGAVIAAFILMPGNKTVENVPQEMRKKWLIVVYLVHIFFIGCILYGIILLRRPTVPSEWIASGFIIIGTIIISIVLTVSRKTVARANEIKREYEGLNESLERRVLERTNELQRSQKKLLEILNSMPYGVILIGKDKKVRSINSTALSLMGYDTEDQVIGMVCNTSLCPAEEGNCPILDLNQTLDRSERTLITKEGKRVPILKTVVIVDLDGEELLLEAFIDISELKHAEEQIKFLAYYDSLTRLPNRTFYKELLTRALDLNQRSQKILAILFIDLDCFKRINDSLGHALGDQLLKTVAERLQKSVRKSDCVARSEDEMVNNTVSRLGGDEFIVLLNEIAHSYNAIVIARRILSDLSQPFMLNNQEVFVTASIGISLYPADGKDVDTLFKNADIAMYYAKEHGKNNFQFYSQTMNAASLERLTMANELHRALERNELVLYYQPKIDLEQRNVTGMEALIRWNHPIKGLVTPSEFIPLAEETGLIVAIGEWVLTHACKQNKEWQTQGYNPITISINIARQQFSQQNFMEIVMRTLKETGLEAHFLELEITESTIMQNPEKAASMLRGLKSTGIKVSIDDFGTGYSSLDHLRWLPLDALKIDRSFVMNIPEKTEDAAIARAIIALAHSLKLKVIAEGVETNEQCSFLRLLGCNEAQGFLFSKPVPAEDFVQFLTSVTECVLQEEG
ncbi:MAG: EAL domain-containing protein [Chitinivibrionales bacterium]|nr:EAL domain-containing protein [Chitinivibrionales bacterium]